MDGQTGRPRTPEEARAETMQAVVDAYRIGPTPPTEKQVESEINHFLDWLYRTCAVASPEDLIDRETMRTVVREQYLTDPYFTMRGDRR